MTCGSDPCYSWLQGSAAQLPRSESGVLAHGLPWERWLLESSLPRRGLPGAGESPESPGPIPSMAQAAGQSPKGQRVSAGCQRARSSCHEAPAVPVLGWHHSPMQELAEPCPGAAQRAGGWAARGSIHPDPQHLSTRLTSAR